MDNNDKKTICIVGVLDKRGSTNIAFSKAALRLGFEVLPINYRTIISSKGNKFFEDMLLYTLDKHRPYLTVFFKCNGMNSDLITKSNAYTQTWLFNPDPKKTIESCPEVIQHAKNANFSSCTGLDIAQWFESEGVRKCHHIIQGIDASIFRPTDSNSNCIADISFIGSKTPERDKYKKVLEDAGYNVKFYGNGYSPQEVVESDFATVCSSSKFMLSLNTYNDIHTEYFSNRLIRYLACGSCVFHLDSTGTLNKYFEDKKDLFYFKNENDLLKLMKSVDDSMAYKVAINGRTRAVNEYTWEAVFARMVNIVRKIDRPSIRNLEDKKDMIGAEIGVFRGQNAFNIFANLSIEHMYLIDPYINDDETKNDSIKLLHNFMRKITWIYEPSDKAYEKIDRLLDFVYIDGDHKYDAVMKDLELYYPKVKSGGLVAGHDFDEENDGNQVKRAVYDFFKAKGVEIFSAVDANDSRSHDFWIFKP